MGTLVSDAGSVGFYGSMASALATGWSDNIAGHNAVMANYSSRYDNTIAYVSPEFAGVTIYAQYAMGDTNENKASNDRYALSVLNERPAPSTSPLSSTGRTRTPPSPTATAPNSRRT